MSDRQAPQSFSFAAGESFELTFATDQVITGMTVRFAVKPLYDSTSVVEAPASATTAVSAAQQCTVTVHDEATEDLLGTYRYSVEVEDGSGDKSEIAWGYLTFTLSMV